MSLHLICSREHGLWYLETFGPHLLQSPFKKPFHLNNKENDLWCAAGHTHEVDAELIFSIAFLQCSNCKLTIEDIAKIS